MIRNRKQHIIFSLLSSEGNSFDIDGRPLTNLIEKYSIDKENANMIGRELHNLQTLILQVFNGQNI